MTSQIYGSVWNKYRPVLLKLMLDSATEPQHYKMFIHEFKSLNHKQKTFAFTLRVFRGKAVNNIRSSEVAIDLLYMLNMSRKASELMEGAGYEFTMDKQCVLRVSKLEDVS